MSRDEKREIRIRQNLRNVSLKDFEALINQYGRIKLGGNHPKAVIGNILMSYRRTNPILPAYRHQLLQILDSSKTSQEK